MLTNLDYDRKQYHVVVRSEIVSPFNRQVEVEFSKCTFHQLRELSVSDCIKKLRADVSLEVVNSCERLYVRYEGVVVPEDIIAIEEVVKAMCLVDMKNVIDVKKAGAVNVQTSKITSK